MTAPNQPTPPESGQQHCCICGEPVSPPYNVIGQRVYCARHFAAVNRPHPSFWRASVVQLIGMAIFALVFASVGMMIGPLEKTPLLIAGLFLAIVPTALWLLYFYRQDRLEPEPKMRVAAVFLGAFALQDIVGRRVINDWFKVSDWASYNALTSLLASVLIVGVVYQACQYVSVRAFVYTTNEFDERMDGIVYGTIAGLGVATLTNLRYVLDNGGVSLAPGVINTVTTALAQAAFGGLMGYFMAEGKFTHKPTWYVPAGFALTAALNGLFTWLTREVASNGLTVEPYRSLAMGVAVAVGTFLVLTWLMRRSVAITLSLGKGAAQ